MSPPYYRDAASGLWGYPTSTMDWCEENYAVTYGIAEFWNTISNIIFIIPPILTIYRTHRQKLLEQRYVVCLLLLTFVGIGSCAFHCTLLYESQLLDELPMVYGTCAMIYAIVEIKGDENSFGLKAAVVLSSISGVVTLGYMLLKTPEFFLWSYGLLAAALFLLHVNGCLKYEGSKKLLIWSVVSYMFGFLLWNIDNEMCYSIRIVQTKVLPFKLRDMRTRTPFFLKPMTQLHAWWHFFAGIGTFLCIIFSLNLRLKAQGYEPSLRIIYRCIPFFVKGERKKIKKTNEYDYNANHASSKVNGVANGVVTNFSRLL